MSIAKGQSWRARPVKPLEVDSSFFLAAEAERVARSLGADHLVPVPRDVPWFPTDVDHWTVCWLLLHLIDETSRHAAHADIVRESVDGATAFPLMAAAENWPPSPWMKPRVPPAVPV